MRRFLVYSFLLITLGCYGAGQGGCDFGTGPVPVPVPIPAPSVSPTASPAPTATPTATPSPTVLPTPAASCVLPTMPDCGNSGCCTEGGDQLFNERISIAQAAVRQARPELFNQDGSLKVSESAYVEQLASTLMTLNPGLCARAGTRFNDSISKDEIGIKVNNTLSQNVDVVIGGSGQPYVGGRYTCRPASF